MIIYFFETFAERIQPKTMSPSSDVALEHLRNIKPHDGWSIEHKEGSSKLMRLTRRKVPLTDSYFLDIHYDAEGTKQVVGILTTGSSSGKVQGQVLVDRSGRLAGPKIALIAVSGYPVIAGSRAAARSSSSASTSVASNSQPTLTDAQNRDLMFFGGSVVASAILFRFLTASLVTVSSVFLPLMCVYLFSTCPSLESFDAKKELKRILRGYHLPEDHPEKPKGMFSETLARIQATVTTELATMPGYEVTMVPVSGLAIIACTRVPSVQRDYYWIGAAKKWWYVYSCEIRNDGNVG